MRKVVAAVVALVAASPAAAILYRFDVFDPSVTQGGVAIDNNTYSFLLDSSPTPDSVTGFSFTVPTTITYRVTFSPGAASDYAFASNVSFFTDPDGGGLDGGFLNEIDNYLGRQLFTGDTSMPTFLTGTFALDQGRSITIGPAPVGDVPEPAAWAMMVAGFGLVGMALRVRSRSVMFA